MPARMVDGDALWRSDKLVQVQPPAYRAEYANLIPLALADGTFECNARRVWADVYSYNRPDITPDIVEKILDEFERVGLLVRIEKNEKMWGYWSGIESRLPSESTRERYKNGAGEMVKSVITRERCVYFIQDSESDFIKIGFCYFDRLRPRVKEIQTGTPGKLMILGVIRNAKRGLENELHLKWVKYQTNSESEWFKNHHDIMQYIEENSEDVDFTDVTFHKQAVQNQSNTNPIPNTYRDKVVMRSCQDWIGLDRIGLDRTGDATDNISAKADFQKLRSAYRTALHKSCSNSDKNEKWYLKVCKEYGENLVLAAFEIWAEDNAWRDKKPELYFFFTEISKLVEGVRNDQKAERLEVDSSAVGNAAVDESIRVATERRHKEIEEENKAFAAEQEAIEQSKANPNAF